MYESMIVWMLVKEVDGSGFVCDRSLCTSTSAQTSSPTLDLVLTKRKSHPRRDPRNVTVLMWTTPISRPALFRAA
ncbi:hypothetical protein RRG08_029656 [Elysia crispata]|uniref:Uncharacterized protein n=1 Tax=Elysia crispata TaxID=231223 RepID=A0AAE0XPR0_9GAST|nr:hypothetical protein RRG08_029656 [Elysia crispata]